MKKNKIVSLVFLSIFTVSALTFPIRVRANYFTASNVIKAGVIAIGAFVGLKLLQNLFSGFGSVDEGEINGVKVKIVQGNIVRQKNADAIVNAANAKLKAGGGVCGAIFSAAGNKRLSKECDSALKKFRGGRVPVGKAVLTNGGTLKQKIIHTVSPNFNPNNNMQASIAFDAQGKKLLEDAYVSSLKLAERNGIHIVAIPFLSGGNFSPPGIDKQKLANIGVQSVKDFCTLKKRNIEEVRFVLYSSADFKRFIKARKLYLSK